MNRCPMIFPLLLLVMLIMLWHPSGEYHPESGHISQLRQWVVARYMACGITGDELATLQALSLGVRSELNPEIKRSFQRSGAMHVLAVSGLHVMILFSLMKRLLTGFGRWQPLYSDRKRQWLLYVALMVMIWGYAFLTGLAPSVTRAVMMVSVAETALVWRRTAYSINTLLLAAFLILIFRPMDLYSVGFQLSFSAVAAILMMQPAIRGNRLWDLVWVSMAAQLGTLPLTAHYFGQMSNYFLLTNLLVLPLAELVLYGALAVVALGGIPVIGAAIGWVESTLISGMHWWVDWVEHLPGSVTPIACSWPMTIALYVAIIGGVLTMKHSNWWLLLTASALAAFIVFDCYGLS